MVKNGYAMRFPKRGTNDADDTVGRAAAERTGEFVSGPYRFEILPGIGHFVADQAPDRLNALLLAYLSKNPV
jgi:pimeloyl-ACP methyl ester carboxylesterase